MTQSSTGPSTVNMSSSTADVSTSSVASTTMATTTTTMETTTQKSTTELSTSFQTTTITTGIHTSTSVDDVTSLPPTDKTGNTAAVAGGVVGAVAVVIVLLFVFIIVRRRVLISKLQKPSTKTPNYDKKQLKPDCEMVTETHDVVLTVDNGSVSKSGSELRPESKTQHNKPEVNSNEYMPMHFKGKTRPGVKEELPSQTNQNHEPEVQSQSYVPMDFKQKINFFEKAHNKSENVNTVSKETKHKLSSSKQTKANSEYENEDFSGGNVMHSKFNQDEANSSGISNKPETVDKAGNNNIEENEYSYAEVQVYDENVNTIVKQPTPKVDSPRIRLQGRKPSIPGPKIDLPLDENEYLVLEVSNTSKNTPSSSTAGHGYFILDKEDIYENGNVEYTKPEVNRTILSVNTRDQSARANADDDNAYYSYCTTEELQTYNKLNECEKRPATFPVQYDRMTSRSSDVSSDNHIYSNADC